MVYTHGIQKGNNWWWKYVLLESDVGKAYTNAWEYIDETGYIGVIRVEYFFYGVGNGAPLIKMIKKSDEKSTFSDAAKFGSQVINTDSGLTTE